MIMITFHLQTMVIGHGHKHLELRFVFEIKVSISCSRSLSGLQKDSQRMIFCAKVLNGFPIDSE